MKKFKLILALAVVFGFIYSCNNSAVQKMSEKMGGDQSDHVCASCAKSADVKVTFENNSKTMQILFDSYANEAVEYSHFADDVVFRGTLLGSADSLGLDEIKGIHKEFFAKYDRRHDLSITATHKLSKKWTLSSIFVYATGNAITLPTPE